MTERLGSRCGQVRVDEQHCLVRPKLRLSLIGILSALAFVACDPDPNASSQGGDIGMEAQSAGERMNSGGDQVGGARSGGDDSARVGAGDRAGDMGDPSEPWIRIGTGFRRFEELASGQEVPIIAGIQGGFHVWGGFIGRGFDDADVRILYTLDLEGMPYAAADYFEFELPKNSRSEFEYAGVSVIYFDNDDVDLTTGQEMTLKVEVVTRDGMMLRDERQLIPICCE